MTALTTGITCGDRHLTRDQLDARSRRAAAALSATGVTAGDSVAILMRNDIAFLEASYGAATIGAYAVPLNWHSKGEEIAYVLADSGAKALIGHADLLRAIAPDLPADLPIICADTPADIAAAFHLTADQAGPIGGMIGFEDWLSRATPYEGAPRPAPQSMIYTSGTTGHPKGVRRLAPTPAQDAALIRLRETVYGLKPGIRTAVPGPLYHSAPNAFALRAGRIADYLNVLPRFEPEALLALIDRERIDTMFMVPTMFIRLLKLPTEIRRRYDLSSLKFIIHAAAPCPPDVKRAMIDWWGDVIWEFYGGTESGPVTLAAPGDPASRPGTVGRAVDGAELRILDDDGRTLPVGQIGEIFCRLDAYPPFTYQNKPDKRAEIDRDGFITCGDVGYLDDDGYLFICDRKRDMVISGGVNIYPAEIEAVLHNMPGVHDCAVFGIPDAEFGEALMAVVEPAAGATVAPDAVRDFLMRHLANYKVPRQIEIARNLPREDSGKIFKRRLRDPYWQDAGRRI